MRKKVESLVELNFSIHNNQSFPILNKHYDLPIVRAVEINKEPIDLMYATNTTLHNVTDNNLNDKP